MIIERINYKKVTKVLSKSLKCKIIKCEIKDNKFTFNYENGQMKLFISNFDKNFKFECDIRKLANLLDHFTNKRSRSIKIGYLKIIDNKLYFSIDALLFEKYILIERID